MTYTSCYTFYGYTSGHYQHVKVPSSGLRAFFTQFLPYFLSKVILYQPGIFQSPALFITNGRRGLLLDGTTIRSSQFFKYQVIFKLVWEESS